MFPVSKTQREEMIVSRKTVWRFVLMLGVAASLSAQSYDQLGVNQEYFPKGAFADKRGDGSFLAGWYSSQLHAMGEPSLSAGARGEPGTKFRFTWLRTFHHPIAARVVLSESGVGTLRLKMADGAGGYKPGKLTMNAVFPLTQDQVQHILDLIRTMGFWQSSTIDANEHRGEDGAEWILEGQNQAGYHVIDRWSPKSGPLQGLGLYLVLDIAKVDIPKRDIY
jgi:hypothetical protein